MKSIFSRWRAGLGLAGLWVVSASAQAPGSSPQPSGGAEIPVVAGPAQSGLTDELFYELLLGEINASSGEPGTGYSFILDAARKTKDPALFRRAVEIALQSRSGDAALLAARAWKETAPNSYDANHQLLQILLALNRIGDTLEPLKAEIALSEPLRRAAIISGIPRGYARTPDKAQAAALVEQALQEYTTKPDTAAAAWASIGQMRLLAGNETSALEAARRGMVADPTAEPPALLALELLSVRKAGAEELVDKYFTGQPQPEFRMAYVRVLLDLQRYPQAIAQLQLLTSQRPDQPQAWLILGSLLAQEKQPAAGQTALRRYLELSRNLPAEERTRGQAQAYLALAQIAESQKDYPAAETWLGLIENSQELISAQLRRASIMARQGKLSEARQLIRSLPERERSDVRTKRLAEVQLLREARQYQEAYQVLGQILATDPGDADLLYDQAMLAEKINRLDDMESLLRRVIAIKPDSPNAYNALGYSLADRNIRLNEAHELVAKALQFTPNDPFISDSMAWVEFRMGNRQRALEILEAAYKARPDAEIAAHLGEVLWTIGQRDRANLIWREGLGLDPDNETLLATLKRLRVKP